MSRIFKSYVSLLQRHTLAMQMATGGVTAAAGDIIYQQAIEKRGWERHQWVSTQRLGAYGAFCFAPVSNRWHAFLNTINVGGKVTTLAARMATDMIFFAPFATSFFYFCQGAMEGRPLESTAEVQGIKDRLGERLAPTVVKQWLYFGPAQIINLTFIPVYARPPFMNMFALGWNVFLASAQNTGAIVPDTARLGHSERSIAQVAVEVME